MQIHELPEITTIASGGYLATDNGTQTTKIDYDKLAKAIIEQYSGSTLAGSAQSVKAALDGLMQKSLPTEIAPRTAIASGDDLNTYTTAGIYRCATAAIAASLSNCPISNVGFNLDVVQLYNVAFAYQRITASAGTTATAVVEVYERFINVRDSMYGTWKKVPTRAEVDALTPTEITGITSAYGTVDAKCYKMGKVVVLAARLTVTSNIPSNQDVITGIPVMATVTNYTPVMVWDDTSKTLLTLDIKRNASSGNNGAFYTRSAIASGASIRISTAYCAQD